MINDIRWHFCKDGDLPHVKRPVTLWDWTDTHGAVVLVETDKQDWVRHESTVCGGESK